MMAGCATAFTYKYYGLAPADWNGTLLGPDPKDDLPFTACAPQPGNAHPCVVVFSAAWFQLKADYQNLEKQLSACQAGQ